MKNQTSSVSNFDLWSAIDNLDRQISLIRQRELNKYKIATQQLLILRAIKSLGSEVTLSKISKLANREFSIITKQTAVLEKDGLIKRTRDNPKSRLLKIELTDKGLKMTEIPRESKAVDSIFAVMNKEQRQQLYEIMNKMFVKAQKVKPS